MRTKIIKAKFFKNESGAEPVREWLKELPPEDRKAIGIAVKEVEFGWPIGMPVVRSISGYPGLWEIRVDLKNGIARVFCVVGDGLLFILHGIIKKTRKSPKRDLEVAKRRMTRLKDTI